MDSIQAFDALFTTNHLQMLKLLLPCLPPKAQRSLAVFIKAAELRYTVAAPLHTCWEGSNVSEPAQLFASFLPYCTPNEKEKLQNMQNLLQSMENMQEIMQVVEAFQEIMPEFAADGAPDLAQILELLGGMNGKAAE